MRRSFALCLLLLALGVLPALPQTVPVPQKRPATTVTPPAQTLPQAQPAVPTEDVQPPPGPVVASGPDIARLRWSACPALMSGAVAGKMGEPVADGDCGVDSPVLVTAIGAVKLSTEATMTCGMATALAAWIPGIDAQARSIMGSPLAALVAGSGYECRNRNRARSGKLSQHAFANAFDIAAFTLADGRSVSVAGDWPQPVNAGKEGPHVAQRASTPQSRFLASAHGAACPLFTTVLGPDADADHSDHIHLDLGCHGRDCRYMICQ